MWDKVNHKVVVGAGISFRKSDISPSDVYAAHYKAIPVSLHRLRSIDDTASEAERIDYSKPLSK